MNERKVRQYTDAELLDRLAGLPTFDGDLSGKIDIWVRSTEDTFDRFDDVVYSYENGLFKMLCNGTSNTGSFGLKHFEQYNSKGAAILCGDTFVRDSHRRGFHKARQYGTKHPAYLQAKGFPYTRDNDKDDKAEEYGKIYNDIIGANCHRADKTVPVFVIKNYSVACLVRNIPEQYDGWLDYMGNDPLSVAILREW
jgi:hypothetical protein